MPKNVEKRSKFQKLFLGNIWPLRSKAMIYELVDRLSELCVEELHLKISAQPSYIIDVPAVVLIQVNVCFYLMKYQGLIKWICWKEATKHRFVYDSITRRQTFSYLHESACYWLLKDCRSYTCQMDYFWKVYFKN